MLLTRPAHRVGWAWSLVVAALAIAISAHEARAQRPATRDPLAGRIKGSASAPVTVYEMSDFQCPYCRSFALETFPALEREYVRTGKVRWAFINFPLSSIHANAVPAAELALCAASRGRFWPLHDLIYRTQEQWAKLPEAGPFLLTLSDSVGLDRAQMLACVNSPETRAAVQADAQGAERAGAGSTPSFYIEGGLLQGAEPLPLFRQVLDSIYALKTRAAGGVRATPSAGTRRKARGSTP